MKLIIILALTSCASGPKKEEYQNTFWLGCMNAMIHFMPTGSGDTFVVKPKESAPTKEILDSSNEWCKNQYRKVEAL